MADFNVEIDNVSQNQDGSPGPAWKTSFTLPGIALAQEVTAGLAGLGTKLTELDNKKVNRTGDTMTGPLDMISNTPLSPWAGTYGLGISFANTYAKTTLITQINGEGNAQALLTSVNTNNRLNTMALRSNDGAILDTSGHIVMVGTGGLRRLRQSFVATSFNAQTITFPEPFSDDNNIIPMFTGFDGGNGQMRIINILANTSPNRRSCQIAMTTYDVNTQKWVPQTEPVQLWVSVEGNIS